MSEENKAITRRFIEEIWAKGDLGLVNEIVATTYVRNDPAGPEPAFGHEGLKETVTMYRTAFPDLNFTIEDQVAEGDRVMTRWTGGGTHQGDLGEIAPTGKKTEVTGIHIARIVGGKIEEEWNNWDTIGLMQQLGVIPTE